MPLYESRKCHRCYGTGREIMIGAVPCDSCMGSGRAYGPSGFKNELCRICGDSGKVTKTYQATCRGTGIVS